jgi:MFS transporter, NNP family, nitrate/nitrite transporter
VLHLSWLAFFVTFIVWFNHAPLMDSIRETFGLTKHRVGTLLIMNVALTIPARIAVGISSSEGAKDASENCVKSFLTG